MSDERDIIREMLLARGFDVSDFSDPEKKSAAFEALCQSIGEKITDEQKREIEESKPTQMPNDFFDRPVIIPMELVDTVRDNGTLKLERRYVEIALKRGNASQALISALRDALNKSETFENMLAQFCDLLYEEPTTLPNFPTDSRSLKERAIAYFSQPGRGEIVQQAILGYRTVSNPSVLFPGF